MYLTHVYPKPESITEDNSRRYTFGAKQTLRVNHELSALAAERIKTLWNRFCCTASELEITVYPDESPNFVGRISDCDRSGELSLESGDEYALHSDENGVIFTARDEKGFLNAFKTLVQLICPDVLDSGRESLYIAAADIRDGSDIPHRSVHLCILPAYRYEMIEKVIHLCGFLKFTHVILEFWGTLSLDCFPELGWRKHDMGKDRARHLVDVARSYGMEVIPMLNHVGHAPGSRGRYGRHVVLDTNPRLARLFEPDGWTWCISNPETYERLAEVRAELGELCGDGSLFHIGGDEADSIGACDRCRDRETYELFAEYVNKLTDDLAKSGRRPILWHDMLINRGQFECPDFYDANGQIKNTSPAIDLLDKRVIIADWEYNYVSGVNPTTPYFKSKDFDVICCSFNGEKNITQLSSDVRKYGAQGIMMTTWHLLYQCMPMFKIAADLFWRGSAYPKLIDDTSALLRTLYDAKGDYDLAGWGLYEIDGM